MGSLAVHDIKGEHGGLGWVDFAGPRIEKNSAFDSRINRESSLKAHKQLPRKRDLETDVAPHRTRYVISRDGTEIVQPNSQTFSPISLTSKTSGNLILPPTPPNANLESDYDARPEGPVTPTQLQRPPTPEYTPPRKVLASQHSIASTRADSFKTAKEDFLSEDDTESPLSEFHHFRMGSPVGPPQRNGYPRRPSPLVRASSDVPSEPVHTPEQHYRPSYDFAGQQHDRRTDPEASESDIVEEDRTSNSQPSLVDETTPKLTRPTIPFRTETTDSQKPRAVSPKQDSPMVRAAWGAAAAAGSALADAFSIVIPSSQPQPHDESCDSSDDESKAQESISEQSDVFKNDNVILNEPRRGPSLRDRLSDSRRSRQRRSTEDFGAEIGWSNGNIIEPKEPVDAWRSSIISNRSTIEAFVVVDPTPQRQQTLRHRGKNNSLRAASSPVAIRRWERNDSLRVISSPIVASNRDSILSDAESPKTLHHKRARLTNDSRWSYNSDVSRSLSMSSAGVLPKAETEIIRVAVIPERASSLSSSRNSSKRASVAYSASGPGEQYPPSSYHNRDQSDVPSRRRTLSDASTSPVTGTQETLGELTTPTVPVRASSLSAPTSRNPSRRSSRANSMTSSTSDHFRHKRIAAEKDLRKTLDRMESDRLISKLAENDRKPPADETSGMLPEVTPSNSSASSTGQLQQAWMRSTHQETTLDPLPEPGSKGWAELRPPSVLDTPFSQSLSMSPGPVEMGEARAVNLFPHNNHSLQVIEQYPISAESRAVQRVKTLMANGNDGPQRTITSRHVESPLQNPRRPPEPPKVKIVPPIQAADNINGQLGGRMISVRRPSISKRRHSGSFVKSITRNLSLKNARNKTAGQDLDSKLHPFWRPRAFWDGQEGESDNEVEYAGDGAVVQNFLGIPQERTVIDGPISLVRHISDSSRQRRQKRALTKQSSHSSLSKLRAGRQMRKLPMLGPQFQFFGLRDLPTRMLVAKQRKEDERREKRRNDLRRSIGANVISQGDSRFLSSMSDMSRTP